MQPVDLDRIYQGLSVERLSGYGSNRTLAIKFYKWNMLLSESLYPLLNTVEVLLRNQLHAQIGKYLKEKNWLVNKNPMILERLHLHWIDKLETNIRLLTLKHKLSEGRLIAEMNFGFWTVLVGKRFETDRITRTHIFWPKLKNSVFPNAHGINMKKIRNALQEIKNLRNRIFHYEPIWHWHDLERKHDNILSVISWIDPTLLKLLNCDRFLEIYQSRPIK